MENHEGGRSNRLPTAISSFCPTAGGSRKVCKPKNRIVVPLHLLEFAHSTISVPRSAGVHDTVPPTVTLSSLTQ
jgi:hypothetical protein